MADWAGLESLEGFESLEGLDFLFHIHRHFSEIHAVGKPVQAAGKSPLDPGLTGQHIWYNKTANFLLYPLDNHYKSKFYENAT